MDDPGHQLPVKLFVFIEQRVPFGLADLLNHHLFGRLGTDPFGHFFRRQRLAVVGSRNRPVGAINLDDDLFVFAEVFLGGGDQRRFDPIEDDLFVDVFVAVDRVNDPKQFAGVHRFSLSPQPGTVAVRAILATSQVEPSA